jgi:hypothetical protein
MLFDSASTNQQEGPKDACHPPSKLTTCQAFIPPAGYFRTGSIQHEPVPPELQEKVKEMALLITHRKIEAKTG